MSDDHCFIDTNVLLYAYDATAGSKHERARQLLTEIWTQGIGCVSVQILQEFYVNVTRKVAQPLTSSTAAQVIRDLQQWRVHAPNAASVLAAIERQQRLQLAFWDAMVLTSAVELGCAALYSEDLSAGRVYDGVRVINPFA
jgi:predicted nucleic acid-binding protein